MVLALHVVYFVSFCRRAEPNFHSAIYIVGGTSNHATYDVYSPKAVKMPIYLKVYEYSTLYLEQNIFPFCVIEGLASKRVLNT